MTTARPSSRQLFGESNPGLINTKTITDDFHISDSPIRLAETASSANDTRNIVLLELMSDHAAFLFDQFQYWGDDDDTLYAVHHEPGSIVIKFRIPPTSRS